MTIEPYDINVELKPVRDNFYFQWRYIQLWQFRFNVKIALEDTLYKNEVIVKGGFL